MNILLDHCVPRRYLRLIQSWGHTATSLSQHLVPDVDDTVVIALAEKLDAVLLTIDLDFANILDYPPADYGGIIVMRYSVADEAAIDQTLKSALEDLTQADLQGALVIISVHRYRIRR